MIFQKSVAQWEFWIQSHMDWGNRDTAGVFAEAKWSDSFVVELNHHGTDWQAETRVVRVNGGLCLYAWVHRSVGALEGGDASQDPVCDHPPHGTARRAHSLLRGSPQESKSITESAGVCSKQLEVERVNERGRPTWKWEILRKVKTKADNLLRGDWKD